MITLNVLAAITSGGALLTWIIQYFVKLRNNVLIRDIREKPFFWTSKGLANIGHSFWLVVVAFAIFILNITILHFLRTKRKKKQDNKRAIVEATTKPNGNLMLYSIRKVQNNDWNKAPLTYSVEAINLTHIEGRIEESCCRPRGGFDTCTNTCLAPAVVNHKI